MRGAFVALGGASLAAEERGAAKQRGRGLGQRNAKFIFFHCGQKFST